MKQNDSIEELFKRLEGSLDLEQTPEGHQRRFMDRLNAQDGEQSPKVFNRSRWKWLSVAATIAILLTGGIFFQSSEEQPEGLASVSAEMEATQSFFVSAISQELQNLKDLENEDHKALIEDTMNRLNALEAEYDKLKVDLMESGNDKRVIAAMINNFQARIELLQQVNQTIEEINTLKANRNETTI